MWIYAAELDHFDATVDLIFNSTLNIVAADLLMGSSSLIWLSGRLILLFFWHFSCTLMLANRSVCFCTHSVISSLERRWSFSKRCTCTPTYRQDTTYTALLKQRVNPFNVMN